MRTIIKVSAGIFITLGVACAVAGGVAAVLSVLDGAASGDATYPAMFGLFAAVLGALSGAGIVLVGGAAYLLSEIDQRLERAIAKAGSPAKAGS